MKKEDLSLQDSLEENFLKFSEDIYDKSEVKDITSYLKNKYQLNVNIIFFCCWLARERYQSLDLNSIQFIVDKVLVWRVKIIDELKLLDELVSQKSNNKSLYDLIDQTISLAEKTERSIMFRLIDKFQKGDTDISVINCALGNVFNYIKYMQVVLHQNDFEKVYRIVKNCIE